MSGPSGVSVPYFGVVYTIVVYTDSEYSAVLLALTTVTRSPQPPL